MKKEDKSKNRKKRLYIIIFLLILILIAGSIYLLKNKTNENKEEKELAYTKLIQLIDEEQIEKIEMQTNSNSIKIKVKKIKEEKNAIIPSTQAFIELIQEKIKEGNKIELIQKPVNNIQKVSSIIFSMLPTFVIIALFILIFKMQGLGDKGKIYDSEKNNIKISFDDVAGLDEEKNELIEIVKFLKEPKKFHEMGAKIPKGILLCGKPGTR